MNVLAIDTHPDRDSFNHAVALVSADALSASGHRPACEDLFGERSGPPPPAAQITPERH